MSRRTLAMTGALCLTLLALVAGARTPARAAGPEWAANVTVIEACSCPMFCQCYFNTKPAGHARTRTGTARRRRSTSAGPTSPTRSTRATTATTSLDGAKFWVATDLGGDFSKGEMDWAVLYFDKSLTPAQRDAIGDVAGQLFPVKWKSFTTAEGVIDKWEFDKDGAHALLDGGKTARGEAQALPGHDRRAGRDQEPARTGARRATTASS